MGYIVTYYVGEAMFMQFQYFEIQAEAEAFYNSNLDDQSQEADPMYPTLWEATKLLPVEIKQRMPIRRT